MSELSMLGVMTPVEVKQIEQGKIAPVLGFVAALPGLGLIYGGPAGAPFFAAALIFVAASYALWIVVDAFYYQQLLARRSAHPRLVRRAPERWALHFYGPMIGYAMASIAASIAGFAGMHGAVTTPVPVGLGFAMCGGVAVGVAAHIGWAMALRNRVFLRVRAIVEASERGPGRGAQTKQCGLVSRDI